MLTLLKFEKTLKKMFEAQPYNGRLYQWWPTYSGDRGDDLIRYFPKAGQRNFEIRRVKCDSSKSGDQYRIRVILENIQVPEERYALYFSSQFNPEKPGFLGTFLDVCGIEYPDDKWTFKSYSSFWDQFIGKKLKARLRTSYDNIWLDNFKPWPVFD